MAQMDTDFWGVVWPEFPALCSLYHQKRMIFALPFTNRLRGKGRLLAGLEMI